MLKIMLGWGYNAEIVQDSSVVIDMLRTFSDFRADFSVVSVVMRS